MGIENHDHRDIYLPKYHKEKCKEHYGFPVFCSVRSRTQQYFNVGIMIYKYVDKTI